MDAASDIQIKLTVAIIGTYNYRVCNNALFGKKQKKKIKALVLELFLECLVRVHAW